MILTTLAKLKQRVNAPSLGAVDARCGALLQAATIHVAAYLRTDFTQVTGVKDVFTLRSADFRSRSNVIRLELRNNLINGAIACNVARSKYGLSSGDIVAVDPLTYTHDSTNGIVKLQEWVALGQVIEVTYNKGLATADDGNGYQLAQNVPSWLEEAALVTAAYHYLLPNIENTDELCDGLPCEAKELLAPYRRGRQDAFQAE